MQDHILQHPSMGAIRGARKNSAAVQYLGIPYASLKDRFARGVMLSRVPVNHPRWSGTVFDATRNGLVQVHSPGQDRGID